MCTVVLCTVQDSQLPMQGKFTAQFVPLSYIIYNLQVKTISVKVWAGKKELAVIITVCIHIVFLCMMILSYDGHQQL